MYKNECKHSEIGSVKQYPIQRTGRSVHMCMYCTVHIILHRTDLIIFPISLQTITIAPLISTRGKGELLMVALWNRADHYIFALWFLLSFLFVPRLISVVGDWMSAILPHMVWP